MKRFCALFVILLTFSYWFNVASAQNAVKIVRIPDANLAAQLRKALGLGPTVLITKQALAELTTLDASRDSKEELDFPISDLTGLEHATQLEELRLTTKKYAGNTRYGHYIRGRGRFQSNGLAATGGAVHQRNNS